MCWKMSVWVMKQKLPSGEKWTLSALAHCLNHRTSQCNPGYKLLAELTGFGMSTVKMHVASLKKMGIITTKAIFTSAGDRTSNDYSFCKAAKEYCLMDGLVHEVDDGVVRQVDCIREGSKKRIENTPNDDESDDSGVDEQDCTEEEASAEKDKIPYAAIVEAYHDKLPQLPRKLRISPKLKTAIKARWREDKRHQNLEFWSNYFDNVNLFDFWGNPKPGDWVCTFDYLVTSAKFDAMVERIMHHYSRN